MEFVNNIQKRETTSIYEDGGRKFQINSYDPLEGNYILMQVLSFVLPFGIGDALKEEIGSELTPKADTQYKMMPKRDFIDLQRDVLKTVYEIYDSGNKSPIIRENGSYGTSDLTMQLTVKLMIASLAFNFKDFFGDVPFLDQLLPR